MLRSGSFFLRKHFLIKNLGCNHYISFIHGLFVLHEEKDGNECAISSVWDTRGSSVGVLILSLVLSYPGLLLLSSICRMGSQPGSDRPASSTVQMRGRPIQQESNCCG